MVTTSSSLRQGRSPCIGCQAHMLAICDILTYCPVGMCYNRPSAPARTPMTEPRRAFSTAAEVAPAMATKIGVDTGGTFSDFMLMDGATLVIHKVLSTPENPARAVLQGLRHLRPDLTGVDVVHGSTVATNTLLERKRARTALITTQGFEDILEIGRQTRPHLYDPFVRKPPPLVPARLRFGVAERLAYNGDVLTSLTEQEIDTVLERVRR